MPIEVFSVYRLGIEQNISQKFMHNKKCLKGVAGHNKSEMPKTIIYTLVQLGFSVRKVTDKKYS